MIPATAPVPVDCGAHRRPGEAGTPVCRTRLRGLAAGTARVQDMGRARLVIAHHHHTGNLIAAIRGKLIPEVLQVVQRRESATPDQGERTWQSTGAAPVPGPAVAVPTGSRPVFGAGQPVLPEISRRPLYCRRPKLPDANPRKPPPATVGPLSRPPQSAPRTRRCVVCFLPSASSMNGAATRMRAD